MSSELVITTPQGPGRLVTSRGRRPFATLLLSHGAGAGIDTPDLQALARHLPRHGITVCLFEQPWKVAGRKVAGAPSTLDEAFVAAADRMRVRTPLVVGGRSAGARSAARTAFRLGAVGCLALAFPLHPPGKPDRSRVQELQQARVPTLVVQGERDAFGGPEDFPPQTEMVVVPAADHSFKVPARGDVRPADVLDLIVESTLEWVTREVVGSGPDAATRVAEVGRRLPTG
jgi:predicted alpha/beta-hydrolase family hydrolase